MLPITSQPLASPTCVQYSPVGKLQERLFACIDGAPHLGGQAVHVKAMARDLMLAGHALIRDDMSDRFSAVAGVQWAMEQALGGTQFIVTAERATPFRTHGDDPQAPEQAVRKAGLIQRLNNGYPLHLVFCMDGVGSENQDACYQRDILARYGAQSGVPVLHEHKLPLAKAEFPGEASGSFILAPDDDRLIAFAIHARQAQQVDQTGRSIELFFGPVQAGASDSPDPLARRLAYWAEVLEVWCNLDCKALARETSV